MNCDDQIEPRLPGIKQGATFSNYLDYSVGGVPEVFSASNLSSEVRRRPGNELYGQLTITAHPTIVGRFLATAPPAMTSTWPVGDMVFDVKRVTNGVTSLTDTIVFNVARAVTV